MKFKYYVSNMGFMFYFLIFYIVFLAGICWQKQVTHYLLPLLEQSSISKMDDLLFIYFSVYLFKNYNISLFYYSGCLLLPNMNFLFVFFRDVMADANILQGAIFHEDAVEDTEAIEAIKSDQVAARNKNAENIMKPLETKPKPPKLKPAVHRVRL